MCSDVIRYKVTLSIHTFIYENGFACALIVTEPNVTDRVVENLLESTVRTAPFPLTGTCVIR